jgi:hypothetical protein
MFNLDADQWRVLRGSAASAFGFWLFSQIADTSLVERLCGQVAILIACGGAFRVWMMESGKATKSRQSPD